MMRFGLVSLVLVGAAGSAIAQQAGRMPAEIPPLSYEGRQYVDSEGCVWVRSGFNGNVVWVPRVDRSRKPICSAQFEPSLSPEVLASLRPQQDTAEASTEARRPVIAPGLGDRLRDVFGNNREVAAARPKETTQEAETVATAIARPAPTPAPVPSVEPKGPSALENAADRLRQQAEERRVRREAARAARAEAKAAEAAEAARLREASIAENERAAASAEAERLARLEAQANQRAAEEARAAAAAQNRQAAAAAEAERARAAAAERARQEEARAIAAAQAQARDKADVFEPGFYVRVGNFNNSGALESLVKWFGASGYQTKVDGGQNLFLGPFRNNGNAQAPFYQAQSAGYSPEIVQK